MSLGPNCLLTCLSMNAYKKVHAHIHVCDFITILGFEFFSTYFPKRCFIIIHTDTGV